MKKIKLLFILIWFILVTPLLANCYYNSQNLQSSFEGLQNKKKIISEENGDKSGYLTYGPYKEIKPGNFIIVIHYSTDSNENTYDVAINSGTKILKTGHLDQNHTSEKLFLNIPETDAHIEIRTLYSGIGNLAVKSILIIPVTQLLTRIIFYTAFLILFFAAACVFWKKGNNQVLEFIYETFLILGVFILGVEIFAESIKYSIFIFYITAFLVWGYMIKGLYSEKKEIFICLSACFINEMLNQKYFATKMHAFLISFLIFLLLLLILDCIIKNRNVVRFVYGVLTVLVLFYSGGQYVFKSYFGSFFSLKVIRLALIGAEAKASVKELLLRPVTLFYIFNILMFLACYIGIYFLDRRKLKNST